MQQSQYSQYATMPTEELLENFQQTWDQHSGRIDQQVKNEIEPIVLSLVNRIVGWKEVTATKTFA